MQRRNLLIGMGSLAAGGAAVLGTGATSMVRAERTVSAGVAGDESAYLGLEAKSEYAKINAGKLELSFPDLNRRATTRFENVFWIRNNGNQDLSVKAFTTDGSDNLNGWQPGDFALYWSQNELSDGNFVYDAMHDVSNVTDPNNGPNESIPRITPGNAIAVHPMFFLRGDGGTGNVPSAIDFYATQTNL